MPEECTDRDIMEYVADHIAELVELLKKAKGSSKVYIVSYLLASARDEASSDGNAASRQGAL